MKKLQILTLSLIILLFMCGQTHAAELMQPWVDIWANAAQYETNGERNNFKSVLGRVDARMGIHLFRLYGDTWIKPYVAYLGVMSQDPAYWNNNGATGIGVRLKPLAKFSSSGWADEWIKDLKIFGEVLSISYYSQQTLAETNNVPVNDTRIGLDLWHEWNQRDPYNPDSTADPSVPWAEVWFNLSQRTTNFYEAEFNSYILYFQPKIGVQSDIGDTGIALEPYLRSDLVMSGKNYTWLNHLDYGAGIRVRPFKTGNFFGNNAPWMSKFKVFAEIMVISWLVEKDSADRPDTDFRFGIDFTFGR